jgi:hypothetical protein
MGTAAKGVTIKGAAIYQFSRRHSTRPNSKPSHGATLVFQNAILSRNTHDDGYRSLTRLGRTRAATAGRASRSTTCLESHPQQPKPSLPAILGKRVISALYLAWHPVCNTTTPASAPPGDHQCLTARDAAERDAGVY